MSTTTPAGQAPTNTWMQYVQYVVVCAIILIPIAWMALSSLKSSNAVTAYPPRFLFIPTLRNFVELFETVPFLRYGINSVVIAGGSCLVGLALAVPAAFAVSWKRLIWPANMTLIARMAPGSLFLLPWYMIFNKIGLINSFTALILTHTVITMPIILWIMVSFFDSVPREVVECALTDGCTMTSAFARIALPLVVPGIVVASVLGFILSWNYFLFALVLSGNGTTPLTVAAFRFVGEGVTDWGMLMAAGVILATPPLLLTFVVQRWLVSGLTFGAVKG